MNNKIIFAITIFVMFACISGVFIAVANAKGLNLLCFKKYNIKVTLKNEAEIEKSKEVILKIPEVKIIRIQYRDKEWSKMVNKYDLPNMENPFKNEMYIKANKNANIEEIFNKIKDMSFVEDIKYIPNEKCVEK